MGLRHVACGLLSAAMAVALLSASSCGFSDPGTSGDDGALGDALTPTDRASSRSDTAPPPPDVVIDRAPPPANALLTTAPDDFVAFPDTALPAGGAARTVEVWAKTTFAGEGYFVAWGPVSATHGFFFGALGGKAVVTNIGQAVFGVTPIADGAFHHVAVACESNACTLYVDGKADATGSMTIDTQLSADGAYVGSTTGGPTKPIAATIDEVRVWSVARSVDSIRANMKKKPDRNDPALLLYFDMDVSGSGPGIEIPQRAASHPETKGLTRGNPKLVGGVVME